MKKYLVNETEMWLQLAINNINRDCKKAAFSLLLTKKLISGPPRNLEIVDYDQESADLKWDAPRDDGGTEITGYLIEKKDKYGNWVRAHEVPGTQHKCTVPNLVRQSVSIVFI